MSLSDDESEKSVKNPHDAAFKAAFRKKELAADFFRTYLPENIRRHIDFDSLEITEGCYVDEKLRDQHSDIVYKTKIRGMEVFLYILFEHQSSPDPVMIFRLLCYMVNLWKEYREQHPKSKKLPVIIPLVLYHGKKKWNSPLHFREMFKGYKKDFSLFVPDFTCQFYDLKDYRDEMLVMGNHMALGAMLHLFKHIFDEDFGQHLLRVMEILSQIREPQIALEFLELALRYVYHARNEDENTVRKYIEQGAEYFDDEKAREVTMTIAERIERRGEKRGRKIGEKTGFFSAYQTLLQKRFGSLPPALEKKLSDANLNMLRLFGDSILDFRDLKEAEKWWEEKAAKNC